MLSLEKYVSDIGQGQRPFIVRQESCGSTRHGRRNIGPNCEEMPVRIGETKCARCFDLSHPSLEQRVVINRRCNDLVVGPAIEYFNNGVDYGAPQMSLRTGVIPHTGRSS